MSLREFKFRVASRYEVTADDVTIAFRDKVFTNEPAETEAYQSGVLLLHRDIDLQKEDIIKVTLTNALKLKEGVRKQYSQVVTSASSFSNKKGSQGREVLRTLRDAIETNPYEELRHLRASVKKAESKLTMQAYVEGQNVIKRIRTESSTSRLPTMKEYDEEESDVSFLDDCLCQIPHSLNLRHK